MLIVLCFGLTLYNINCLSHNIVFGISQDFKLKSGQFDISLIPDIYDCIKYDVQHNRLELDLKPHLHNFQTVEEIRSIMYRPMKCEHLIRLFNRSRVVVWQNGQRCLWRVICEEIDVECNR